MHSCYEEIKKVFNYYIREYYYQKSQGTHFVYFRKPGVLFTPLKYYKKKKVAFPDLYYWYFDNLRDHSQNKDIFQYAKSYDTRNIYSYKINEEEKTEKKEHFVKTEDIYVNEPIDTNEDELKNVYKTSNLYFNIHPVYLSKICLYDLNEFHILFSNDYRNAFMQFYYSLISFKIDMGKLQIFPNLRILTGHIKNISKIINDEIIKQAYIYLVKQKKIFDTTYIYSIFVSAFKVLLHGSSIYLFLDNPCQVHILLRVWKETDLQSMFESSFPYPYYLIVDESINIYNLQNFQFYLNEVRSKQKSNNAQAITPDSLSSAFSTSNPNPNFNLKPNFNFNPKFNTNRNSNSNSNFNAITSSNTNSDTNSDTNSNTNSNTNSEPNCSNFYPNSIHFNHNGIHFNPNINNFNFNSILFNSTMNTTSSTFFPETPSSSSTIPFNKIDTNFDKTILTVSNDYSHMFESSTNLRNVKESNFTDCPNLSKSSDPTKKIHYINYCKTTPQEYTNTNFLENLKYSPNNCTRNGKPIYFFHFTKIFDMKPNFRFVENKC